MRHAAREFTDDRLSSSGLAQAARLPSVLTDALRDLKQSVPSALHCSPKKRTQATLLPLSTEHGSKIVIDDRLDEQKQGESIEVFEDRVKEFSDECLQWAEKPVAERESHVRLACSHLDWLETTVLFLPSDENDFERSEPWLPMAIRVYVFDDGIWKRKKAL